MCVNVLGQPFAFLKKVFHLSHSLQELPPHWGKLYNYFYQNPIKAPDMPRCAGCLEGLLSMLNSYSGSRLSLPVV